MSGCIGDEGRHRLRTDRLRVYAAGVKATARRGIDGIGRIPRQWRLFRSVVGVHRRNRREQGACVGMLGLFEQCFAIADFNNLTKIHHHHTVGDIAHNVQVVTDENVRQAKILF